LTQHNTDDCGGATRFPNELCVVEQMNSLL